MPQPVRKPEDRYARFERALVKDRDRKRRDRAALNAAGEYHGARLDVLVIDAVALLLRGRSKDDPVREGFMTALHTVLTAHSVPLSPGFRSRLHARMSVNTNLRQALAEAEMTDLVRDLEG